MICGFKNTYIQYKESNKKKFVFAFECYGGNSQMPRYPTKTPLLFTLLYTEGVPEEIGINKNIFKYMLHIIYKCEFFKTSKS